MRRDEGKTPPLGQLLFSPAVGQVDPDSGKPWPSEAENAKKSLLTPNSLKTFGDFYLGNPALYERDIRVNPIMAKSLAALPPAFITICELDPLRDQGRAYAERMRAAGVRVETLYLPGKDHAYQDVKVISVAAAFLRSL
jgi:acetyl esterase